jgi:enamine deaminase RidA (YjgF/YER057c/UK114 family)
MRNNISGGSPFEPIIGFSRAVRVENSVLLSGTGPVGAEDEDAAGQTRRIFSIAAEALKQAGSSLEHVVRTRMYLTRAEDWEAVGRVHGEFFWADSTCGDDGRRGEAAEPCMACRDRDGCDHSGRSVRPRRLRPDRLVAQTGNSNQGRQILWPSFRFSISM